MPFIAVLNFLQYFDKSSLNYSGVLTLKADTGITSAQYSWLGSIFYLGYLLFQGPNAILLQRVPIAKYMGSLIVIWGVVLTVTSEGKNFSQLAALRFLLGFFEAGIYPCCIMLISSMYRRTEQSIRIGMVYICNGIAMAVGGLVSYGIGHMENVLGKSSWQWIMIILGSVTILFGLICFFFLIDNPKSRFLRLTPEQDDIVNARLRDNSVVRTTEIKYSHMLESLREPRFYCFVISSLLIDFQNGALGTFSSIITAGFGFSNLNAILLSVPAGVVDCLYIAFAVWFNRRYGHTIYTSCILFGVSIVGLILLIVIPTPEVKLVGLYMCWSFPAAYTLILVSIANNVAGYTKKIFYSTGMMIMYTFGNFIGPQMMVSWQAPLYLGGMIAYICSDAICIGLLLVARHYMAKSNRERLANPSNIEIDVNDDLTDVENPNYIYRL
ncbi:major facilitator superfamily domain-containing protein [Phycomyces nitens]|nr:major facilitator superfamily domain-containing protein [Phycomyces nitens]